jgi:hypothetical protein
MWQVVAIPADQSRVARIIKKKLQPWGFDMTVAE